MTALSRPLITAALAGAATGARSLTGLATPTRLAGAAAPAVVIALAAAVVLTER
jgi:hypothetical protein